MAKKNSSLVRVSEKFKEELRKIARENNISMRQASDEWLQIHILNLKNKKLIKEIKF